MQPSTQHSANRPEAQEKSRSLEISKQALHLELARRFTSTGEQDITHQLLALNQFGTRYTADQLWQEAANSPELLQKEKELRAGYRQILQQGDRIREKLQHAESEAETASIVEKELIPLLHSLYEFTCDSHDHDLQVCNAVEVLAEQLLQSQLESVYASAGKGALPARKVLDELSKDAKSPETVLRDEMHTYESASKFTPSKRR